MMIGLGAEACTSRFRNVLLRQIMPGSERRPVRLPSVEGCEQSRGPVDGGEALEVEGAGGELDLGRGIGRASELKRPCLLDRAWASSARG